MADYDPSYGQAISVALPDAVRELPLLWRDYARANRDADQARRFVDLQLLHQSRLVVVNRTTRKVHRFRALEHGITFRQQPEYLDLPIR
jgi:hypothetical protein